MLFNTLFLSALEQFDLFTIFGHQVGGVSNIILILFLLSFAAYVVVSFDTQGVRNPAMLFTAYSILRFLGTLVSENISGTKNLYFHFHVVLFTLILWTNLAGLVPYSLTVTSYLVVALYLGGTTFFGSLIVAFSRKSFDFFGYFMPVNAPFAIRWLLCAIELVSCASRLFSLAIRLFANMLAGHALLKILSGFVFLAVQSGPVFLPFAILGNFVVIAVTVLEVLIAGLQAYVFVVLSTIYANEGILYETI